MSPNIFKGATVLITGASSGIGEAFAHSLAKRGANLILTARSKDKLTKIADDLSSRYQISAHTFPMDLSLPDAAQELFDCITSHGLTVDLLINNAGFGKWTHFLCEDIDTYDQMLSLNINALVRLTYLYVKEMLARGTGGVINVASAAAFQPMPFVAVYAASKSFVLSFTEALAGEYGARGVRFLALCPGPTDTNFNTIAHVDTAGTRFATSDEVAEAGLRAFAKGKSYHIHGRTNYILSFLPRILSRTLVICIVAKMFKSRVHPCPI